MRRRRNCQTQADGQSCDRLPSRVIAFWVGLAVWVLPGVSWADDDPTDQLVSVLDNIRNTILGIAGTLVVVMLTIAGVRYLLGAGDPSQTEKAKTALMAAVVGFAIVILAPVLVAIVKGILGAG